MHRSILHLLHLCLLVSASTVFAQSSETPIRIFGYFQNQFEAQSSIDAEPKHSNNSFILQQLNLFFQKDLHKAWSAFISVEMLNSFSDSRRTGAVNLDEAWVKFRSSKHFNLKLGLQIPIFNNFNEIKNRTPLLPYIIRPLAYETSFNETIDIEAFIPGQAFAQAYGFKPIGSAKLDYALYLGNSPNIIQNNAVLADRSGADSTTAILVGGRLGLRLGEVKLGSSVSYDRVNDFKGLEVVFGGNADRFELLPRVRFGLDLSANWKSLAFESEFVQVQHDDDLEDFSIDKQFLYATAGCRFLDDRLFAFLSYWQTNEDQPFILQQNGISLAVVDIQAQVPNIGFSYNLTDLIRLKAHHAFVTVEGNPVFTDLFLKQRFNYFTAAVSVIFK
ncbi:MAG: hypothetical protein ACRBF0_03175 [Calditrichia bacterium]